MYTLSTCPWCRKTKKYFTDNKIPFEYVDYDLQPPAEQQKIEKRMVESGESLAFPWVLIGEELVIGWNPEKYAQLLGISRVG